ncbi:uncharacterized protein LOC143196873 isoform X1 [Rhynchophorus ferrugineus]|uniref:Uncharacterized protein n=1 Tax=Rhynchophorus ferrugineus TaxID=354439 RepID=A0A834M6U6_RHYFE|nr:hypothetical protein GWI33_014496 [Rhynchophorus ferrugineus]
MHFWINKGNHQGHYWPRGCAFVRPPPEAVANYLSRPRPRGLYPKPMVTPVRRFQSLESVSNNTIRNNRSSPHHRPNRPAVSSNTQIFYYTNSSNVRIPRVERSLGLDNTQTSPQILENNELKQYIRKFKFALLLFGLLSICVFFGANYLTTGQLWRLGVETLVIISIACVVLLLGGIILLYLDGNTMDTSGNHSDINQQNSTDSSNNQTNSDEFQPAPDDIASSLSIHHSSLQELPPPPYHIAIRLSNQNNLETIQILDDQSPPPPYEKAVT